MGSSMKKAGAIKSEREGKLRKAKSGRRTRCGDPYATLRVTVATRAPPTFRRVFFSPNGENLGIVLSLLIRPVIIWKG